VEGRLDLTGSLAATAMGIMPHEDMRVVLGSEGLDKEKHF